MKMRMKMKMRMEKMVRQIDGQNRGTLLITIYVGLCALGLFGHVGLFLFLKAIYFVE